MKKSRADATRGSAIVTAMCLVLAILIFSVGYLVLPWQEYLLNHRTYCGAVALSLAEAGVDYTYWAINTGGNIDQWSGTPKTWTVSNFTTYSNEVKGDFTIRAWPTAVPGILKPEYLVESVGSTRMLIPIVGIWQMVPITRTVKAMCVLDPTTPFSGAILAASADLEQPVVVLNGGVRVDSYDSRDGAYGGTNIHDGVDGREPGEGDIATNSSGNPAINFNGTGINVYGDVMTGEGGSVDSKPGQISGSVTHDFSETLEYNPIPNNPWDPQGRLRVTNRDVREYQPGSYSFTTIVQTGGTLTFNGPATVYITGDRGSAISQTGGGSIVCNGRVEFYVSADVSLNGNGLLNASTLPTNCYLYGDAGCTTIDIGGSNKFYGAVYAPTADVVLSGSEDKYGSFVGDTVTLQGGLEYHYDEALGDETINVGKYSLRHWQEI